MTEQPRQPSQKPWTVIAIAALSLTALLVAAGAAAYYRYLRPQRPEPPIVPGSADPIDVQVHHFCGGCHKYPPAETFPKRHWKEEVERGYQFFGQAGMNLRPPPIDDVIQYYMQRAPEELPAIDAPRAPHPVPVRFEPNPISGPALKEPYAVSNISLVHLFGNKLPDILACDMRNGVVMALQPYAKNAEWKIIGNVPNPAHAEVVDLDGDGILDVLVADLGSFKPTDRRCGSVVWLRGQPDGSFKSITLLTDVGRVADVQAADFRGVGKLDLVVASFGWNHIGEIIYLENQTTDWSKPVFKPRELDSRHGAIHVPVVDLDGDGKPDFVAVIAQEHETVVAFLNNGNGGFRKETIWAGPHPAYGSSGIQMVDMNGDGRLDVLYTNGDTLDAPYLLKPYHSVQWLENPGDGTFPWKHHAIAPLYGAHRAVAADLCGTGKMDVVAVSFLPPEAFPQRKKLDLDALLFLERTGPDLFARHAIARATCDAVSCAVGDLYGTGRNDIVTGLFTSSKSVHNATIWKNLGKTSP